MRRRGKSDRRNRSRLDMIYHILLLIEGGSSKPLTRASISVTTGLSYPACTNILAMLENLEMIRIVTLEEVKSPEQFRVTINGDRYLKLYSKMMRLFDSRPLAVTEIQ